MKLISKSKRVFVVPEEPLDSVESPKSAEDEDLASLLPPSVWDALVNEKRCSLHWLVLEDALPPLSNGFSSARLFVGYRVAYFSTTQARSSSWEISINQKDHLQWLTAHGRSGVLSLLDKELHSSPASATNVLGDTGWISFLIWSLIFQVQVRRVLSLGALQPLPAKVLIIHLPQ